MPKANTRTRSATHSNRRRVLKARKGKVIDEVLEEIDKLPIDPRSGVLFRGSMLKVINEYKALYHWLSRDMITSKRKREKKVAEEADAAESAVTKTKKTGVVWTQARQNRHNFTFARKKFVQIFLS